MRLPPKISFAACLLLFGAPATLAQSQDVLLAIEANAAIPAVAPQSARFGPGVRVGGRFYGALSDVFLLGVGADATVLSDGAPVAIDGVQEPGVGTIYALTLRARFRPLAPVMVSRERGTGLFVDLAGGGAVTGTNIRPVVGASLGWGFAVGDIDLAPVVSWQTVFEVDNPLDRSPAHTASIGAQISFFDPRASVPPPPEPAAPSPPSDRDGDGFLDDADSCPDEPEDRDDFEDDDGCPDVDNDDDAVPDTVDECPMEPEDQDEVRDEDGCPDLDNDHDGILDEEDHCPNEPERLNGIDDHDGCPDEGLIELVDDHVILEEHVVFDFNSSRLARRSLPVLAALVELIHQHPEWVGIRVEGHACTLGAHGVNQRISEARANAVRDELVREGIAPGIVDAVGLGETQPRAWGESEGIHERNRRVEIIVQRRREVQTIVSPAREDGQSVEERHLHRESSQPSAEEGVVQ